MSRRRVTSSNCTRWFLGAVLLAAVVAAASCEPPHTPAADQTSRPETPPTTTGAEFAENPADRQPEPPAKLEPTGYVQKAELRDLPGGVVDGDTLKAVGFSESLRLLNINTEELLHRHKNQARAADDWQTYVDDQTDGDGFETFGTPLGEQAKSFARQFFADVHTIWLEYQSPIRTHGFFGRHLVYVWVKKDGQWVNYNLEAVRHGMSAYYTKYGFSERLHGAFLARQRQARQRDRGIWAPGAKSYPDYPARMAWWNRRASQIEAFSEHFANDPRFVDLATDTAFGSLRKRLGRRVVVFGQPESFAERGNPQRIRLSYRYRRDFPVVAFEPVDMRQAAVDPDDEAFIYVEGVVGMYRGDPQLRYDAASWMRSGTNPPDDLMESSAK